jgi:gamma-glutamyltranspeptidase/glutathione hydrolase
MRCRATLLAVTCSLTLAVAGLTEGATGAPPEATAPTAEPPKTPTAVGRGGAVSSVDPNASRIGLQVLKNGGNAVDAAVATAAALGVAEPYSAGVGGGGYFVYYDAGTGRVHTIDGRETAPMAMPTDAFIDPATGAPYPFSPDLVTSGVSVGVPGTPATWTTALRRWGSQPLPRVLEPAARLAERGFVVDQTFRQQTADNQVRFDAFTSTRSLFLRGGLPEVGSTFTNPALARTYREFGHHPDLFYRGRLPGEIVDTVRNPPVTDDTTLPVPPGFMSRSDLRDYAVKAKQPTSVDYRGYRVVGMAPSSSGGTTVGEALNILENHDLADMDDADALHHYLEASALAFADRGRYVGDPAYVDVPVGDLLSQEYADERACLIDPAAALTKPVAAGDVTSYDGQCDAPAAEGADEADTEGQSTTHLTVSDRWGNVVSYTLTIEQTGGSGIVVPGRGFLLNNELTDFSTVYNEADPNRIQPGKRPRSSMSPTIVFRDGRPFLAVGSPGGSTIITTVLQILFNRIDRGMTIPDAIAAPRASQRNTATVTSEPAFIDAYGGALAPYGHSLASTPEIGAAAGIEFGPDGLLTAVAEPVRRGGGSAMVVRPR